MSKVDEIEQAIRALPPEDLAALRNWFADFDAEMWDRQLEHDVAAGRLDRFVNEALSDLNQGRCTDI
jgi:hypothetical protein